MITVIQLFERAMQRLFCGAECWEVCYRLHFDTGYIEGVHRTFRSLSKHILTTEGEGFELAKEIASEFRFKTGAIPESCTIVSVKRLW